MSVVDWQSLYVCVVDLKAQYHGCVVDSKALYVCMVDLKALYMTLGQKLLLKSGQFS